MCVLSYSYTSTCPLFVIWEFTSPQESLSRSFPKNIHSTTLEKIVVLCFAPFLCGIGVPSCLLHFVGCFITSYQSG